LAQAKKILLLTAKAGLGHWNAARAIASVLQKTHGDGCVVHIANAMDDERVPGLLRDSQTDYDRVVQNIPRLYKFGYQASDKAVPGWMLDRALAIMLFRPIRDLVQQHEPDLIIAPFPLYHAPLKAVYAITGQHIPLLTVVTDLATVHRVWFNEVTDLCVVPTEAVRDLALRHGLPREKVEIVGIPVDPRIDEEEREPGLIREELGWDRERVTILAVGGKRVRGISNALSVLNHSGFPLQLVVLAGEDEELHRWAEKMHWHVPTHRYDLIDDMPAFMRASDCILCKAGGLIVTESLASGLPLLLIDVLPGQEAGNAQHVVDGGAGKLVDTPVEALQAVCHWLEHDAALLAKQAQKAHQLGRPRAAYDVAELAWEMAQWPPSEEKMPPSKKSDLIDALGDEGIR